MPWEGHRPSSCAHNSMSSCPPSRTHPCFTPTVWTHLTHEAPHPTPWPQQRPGNLLHPSPWPGQGAKQPRQRAPRLPSTPRAFPHFHALIRPASRGPDRPRPDRRSRREPQPCSRRPEPGPGRPLPRPPASPWGPAPGPAAPAVLSPARGLPSRLPGLTDSGPLGASLPASSLAPRKHPSVPTRGGRVRGKGGPPAARDRTEARPAKGLGRSRQPAQDSPVRLRPPPRQGLVQAVWPPGLAPAAPPPHPATPAWPATRAHRGSLPACPARTHPPPARCCARARPHGARPRARRVRALPRLRGAPARAPAPGPRPAPRSRLPAPAGPGPGSPRPHPSAAPVARADSTARRAPGTSPDAPGSRRGLGSLSTGVTPQPEGDLPAAP